MVDERTLRVAPLSPIEPLLRSLGYDPEPIFGAVGLELKDFQDIDNRISYTNGACLLGGCAKTTGYDHFGLLLGQFFLITQMGIPGQLANTASNVGEALHDIVSHMNLHDQGGVATLTTVSRYSAFGYAITTEGVTAADQVYDLCVSICCGILRSFCGPDWNPARVELSRSEPKNSQPYSDYFHSPVQFNSVRSAVVFSKKWLDHPLLTADSHFHKDFEADAERLHHDIPKSVSQDVRIALYSRLTNADCTASGIADLLGIHERTLHRRLQGEGTSFRRLLDETRKVSSCNYLKVTTLPISSIASALGYGSTGAFDHAFKRWHNQSPKQWRDGANGGT